MINVNIEQLTGKGNVNKYSLVAGVAKRAKIISDQAKIDNEILYDRPVSTSFDELVEGKYEIIAENPDVSAEED